MRADVIEDYRRQLGGVSPRGAVLMGLRSALRLDDLSEHRGLPQPAERSSRLRVAAKWVALGWGAPAAAADVDAADIEAYLACTRSDEAGRDSYHAAVLSALERKYAAALGKLDQERAHQTAAAADAAAQEDARHATHAAHTSALAAALIAAGDAGRAIRHSFAAVEYAWRATMAVWPAPTGKSPDATVAFDAATRADLAAIRAQEAGSPRRRPSMLTLGPLWSPDAPPRLRYWERDEPYGCALEIEIPVRLRLDDVVEWVGRLLCHVSALSLAQGGGGLHPRLVVVTPRRSFEVGFEESPLTCGRILHVVLEHVRDDPPEQTRALLAEILHAQTIVRAERGLFDTRRWIRGHVCVESDAAFDARILAELQAEPGSAVEYIRRAESEPMAEPLAQRALREVVSAAPRCEPPLRYGPFLRGLVGPLSDLLQHGEFRAGRMRLM